MHRFIATLVATAMLTACASYGPHHGPGGWRNYDYNRPDPAYGAYHANRYYRADKRYRERVLTRRDRIYRGTDGRYYCRRPDGTTGLVVGAISGAVLGNIIARGDSELLGTIIGAAAGAALGREIDRGNVRCRYDVNS